MPPERGRAIRVGEDVRVGVMDVRGSEGRLGIEAPANVPLYREQLTAAERQRYRIGAHDKGAGEA